MLGQNKGSYVVPRFHGDEERFFVEGLCFPDAGFTGLVSFHVTLLDDSNEVGGGWAEQVTGETAPAGAENHRLLATSPAPSLETEAKRLAQAHRSPDHRTAGPQARALSSLLSPCRVSPSPRSSLTLSCSAWHPGL